MQNVNSSSGFKRTFENVSADDGKIRICFNSQDGNKDYYKVDDDTKIQTLIKAYCKKKEVEYKTVAFIFDGKRLPFRGTINQAGLMDQDEIDVMVNQTSGGDGTNA